MIKRAITETISLKLGTGKAVLLFGPRQTGKTTLLHQLFDTRPALGMKATEKLDWGNE